MATLALAAFMEQHAFAALAVALSAATIVSLLLTLQIERAYVRIPLESISSFVAAHAVIILAVSLAVAPLFMLFSDGLEVLLVALAIALNQMTSYYSARTGSLRRIWLIKFVQALVLAGGVGMMIAAGRFGLAGWIFGLAWLTPAIIFLDHKVWRNLPQQRFSTLVECVGGALTVSRVALLSMTFFNVVREGPVLIAGLLNDPATAAALGLANRVVAQPMGLLGRSVSMVLANFAASGKAGSKVPTIICLLVGVSTAYCVTLAVAAMQWPILASYTLLATVTLAMTPLYVGHLAIGALGPYLIAENLYYREMWIYAIQAAVCAALGVYLWFWGGSVVAALWIISAVVVLTVAPFIAVILAKTKTRLPLHS